MNVAFTQRVAEQVDAKNKLQSHLNRVSTTFNRRLLEVRVERFATFGKLVLATTSKILRILIKHIESKDSIDSKLQTVSIYSIEILIILKVIAKTSF